MTEPPGRQESSERSFRRLAREDFEAGRTLVVECRRGPSASLSRRLDPRVGRTTMKWKMAALLVALGVASAGSSRRPSVPGSADQAGRSIARRLASGHRRPAPHRQNVGNSRPAGDRGEPRRRRRHHRSQVGRRRGSGRLHADAGKHEHPSYRAVDLQECRIQRGDVLADFSALRTAAKSSPSIHRSPPNPSPN